MKVSGALLVADDGTTVPFVRSPNSRVDLRFLVLHYTAGLTARGAIEWFKNPAAAAAAHLVIDRAGAIAQIVGFDRRAWH